MLTAREIRVETPASYLFLVFEPNISRLSENLYTDRVELMFVRCLVVILQIMA